MPSPAWDNLDAFLQADDFAIEATVTPQGGVARGVSGIFDEPYLNTQIGEYEADASQPRLNCKAVDVADLRAKDTVEIEGQVYHLLTGPQFDGTGFAVLSLAKV
ncbi:head-tail joining protein [Pseudophaeobacter flagellatus]|uniref:head-tail joining protein n=1 Tax=Pseudophaeobacter flagellatus TaxID=2899119 RepID=UPI001E5175B3|nr:head-tail joining protein [Pseudophaeobacter flagellatus]MCD9147815.1 head-tail joining protein [Pseudophaeobacter flagellatus]